MTFRSSEGNYLACVRDRGRFGRLVGLEWVRKGGLAGWGGGVRETRELEGLEKGVKRAGQGVSGKLGS